MPVGLCAEQPREALLALSLLADAVSNADPPAGSLPTSTHTASDLLGPRAAEEAPWWRYRLQQRTADVYAAIGSVKAAAESTLEALVRPLPPGRLAPAPHSLPRLPRLPRPPAYVQA